MNVGINGRFLTKPFTGIGQYTLNLLKSLSNIDKENVYYIAVPEDTDLNIADNFQIETVREKKEGNPGVNKTFWEQVKVPNYFKDKKVDLVHYPYPSNPRFSSKIKTLVTVHDIIPWILPEYRDKLTTKIYQKNVKKALKKADYIITVSNKTKTDLLAELKFPPENIRTIHNGVNPALSEDIDQELIKEVIERYNLLNPFYFYMGGYDKRKNVEILIETFLEEIAPNYNIDLVLGGGKSLDTDLYDSYDIPQKECEMKGRIIKTGFISEEILNILYKNCIAFINLSKYEGFNIPLVEAAYCNCPIIASDIEIHREVLNDCAMFIDPDDKEKLAHYMKLVSSDENFRNGLIEKTENIKNIYSWDKTARETLSLYKEISTCN